MKLFWFSYKTCELFAKGAACMHINSGRSVSMNTLAGSSWMVNPPRTAPVCYVYARPGHLCIEATGPYELDPSACSGGPRDISPW